MCGLFFALGRSKHHLNMKRLLVLLLVFGLSHAAIGQDKGAIGFKGGINISNTNNTESGKADAKLGFHAGLLAHFHITPAFSLQPEVVFSRQGATQSNVDVHLDYINIPVLLQYNFNNGFRLQTGPQVGFLTNVESKVDGVTTDAVVRNNFKSTDFSWSLGGGYLTESGLGIDIRHNLGLSKINDVSDRIGKTTNRVWQIGLFYLIDNDHKRRSR